MDNECTHTSELIIAYINKTIDAKDTIILMTHLSNCPSCREDLKDFLFLQSILDKSLENIPVSLRKDLYSMLPENSSSLRSMTERYSSLIIESSNELSRSFRLVKKSINLAFQLI